jgi:hypothetical protein
VFARVLGRLGFLWSVLSRAASFRAARSGFHDDSPDEAAYGVKSACIPWLVRVFLHAFERGFDDIHLLGFDLTGPRVAALFELYALPFYQQVEDFVAIIDVDENIPAIVAGDEAVPFIRPEEFDRAVLHSNFLNRSD